MAVTFSEAKKRFKDITVRYFKGANVIYANQSHSVKPTRKPLVTIAFGNIKRPLNPPTTIVDGRPVSFYPASVPITLNLFTHGRIIEIAKGITPAMEDTASEDLMDFLSFLNSDTVIQYCGDNDIAILVPNDVMPLSGIINDVAYEYRAKVEIELRFTSIAAGYSGTLPAESVSITSSADSPEIEESHGLKTFGDSELFNTDNKVELVIPKVKTSSSGGSNEDFLGEEDYYFANVILSGKKVKPDDDSANHHQKRRKK